MNTRKKPSDDFCLESPDKKTIYVSIPKNASSFVSDWLMENGWTTRRIDSTDPTYVMVILRDPVDRWISGIAQYLESLWITADQITEGLDKVLFDIVDGFDDHTWPQHIFFEDVHPTKSRIWFRTDLDLMTSIGTRFRLELPKTENFNKKDQQRRDIADYLKQRMTDPMLSRKIQEKFQRDHDIISRADFTQFGPPSRGHFSPLPRNDQ